MFDFFIREILANAASHLSARCAWLAPGVPEEYEASVWDEADMWINLSRRIRAGD